MNKKNKLSNIWTVILVALCSLLVFTTCENNDALNTDSLADGATTMKAFGPNPALRGQKLSFAGTHLDKITKVILPNGIEITDIEVVSDKLIKVHVPQETVEGIIRLIGPNNLEIKSKEPLSISEPTSITAMTPQPVKAGQTLTIEGDYFNFFDRIVFTDNVVVLSTDCKTWTRTKIEVLLPAEAQSGVVTLSTGDEIPLEYQSPNPLQVVLPSVNTVLDLTGKKPGDAITTAGKDLDLVAKVEMPNGDAVPFTIENSALNFTLPENVSDGAIVMIPASGVRVAVANIGVAIPAEIVVTPDKGLRAGDEITIKGINMELVKSVKFSGVDAAVTPSSKSATEIKVAMPDKAISGEITLNTASGKTVTAEIETLKPDVVAYNPKPAPAGSTVKLQGHHLDLVTTVTFGGKLVVSVTPGAADELPVDVPLNAVSGIIVLTMANGETVECPELEITEPPFAYIPNPPGPKAEIHAGGVLTVEVGNGDKLTDIQINGKSVKYIFDAPKLYIVIPGNAKGDTELKLVSSNGTATYTIPVIGAGIVETVVYEGLHELVWGAGLTLNKDLFETVLAGSKLKVYLTVTASGASIKFGDAGWTGIAVDHPAYQPGWETVALAEGTTDIEITLTAEILNRILTVKDDWSQCAMMLTGTGAIVSKVSIISGSEPAETVVFEGPVDLTWSDAGRAVVGASAFNGVRAGATMTIYFTQHDNWGQAQISDGGWAAIPWPELGGSGTMTTNTYDDKSIGIQEFILTQDILDLLDAKKGIYGYFSETEPAAIIIQGGDWTINKITVK